MISKTSGGAGRDRRPARGTWSSDHHGTDLCRDRPVRTSDQAKTCSSMVPLMSGPADPSSVEFATKPELAIRMLRCALDAGVPASWVTGDEVYGPPRSPLVLASPRDVLRAVRREQPVGVGRRPGAGPLGRPARPSLTDPTDCAYYLCSAPVGTTLATLVAVAGKRWAIEETFQTGKTEVGLDHYQVRRYDGWYRHITLAMFAHAFLTVTRAASAGKGGHQIPAKTSSRSPSPRSAGSSAS